MQKCKHIKPNGTSCNAFCLSGSDFCFHHDPAREQERAAARRKGGRERSKQQARPAILSMSTEAVKLSSVADVLTLLSETATDVRAGAVDPKTANCLAYLASVGLRAIQDGDFEQRLERLEQLAHQQGRRA